MGTLTFLFCSILFFLFSLVPWWIMIDLRCTCTSPGTHFCREGCFSQGVPKNTFLRLFLQENRFFNMFSTKANRWWSLCMPSWLGWQWLWALCWRWPRKRCSKDVASVIVTTRGYFPAPETASPSCTTFCTKLRQKAMRRCLSFIVFYSLLRRQGWNCTFFLGEFQDDIKPFRRFHKELDTDTCAVLMSCNKRA